MCRSIRAHTCTPPTVHLSVHRTRSFFIRLMRYVPAPLYYYYYTGAAFSYHLSHSRSYIGRIGHERFCTSCHTPNLRGLRPNSEHTQLYPHYVHSVLQAVRRLRSPRSCRSRQRGATAR